MKIAPCPVCGNHQTRLFPIATPGDYRFVECMNCGATGSHNPSEAEAIAAWTRLAQAVNVFEAALVWQQAITTVNGVHAAEQALLAALKDMETINPKG